MRFKCGISFLVIISLAVLLASCSPPSSGKSEVVETPPEISRLVAPAAKEVLVKPLDKSGKWQIVYEVEAPYPPKGILDFLRKNMRDDGFFPDRLGEKGFWSWVEHLDTSKEEETYVMQYMAPWSTLQGNEVALVSLQYVREAGEEYGNTLKCFIIYR